MALSGTNATSFTLSKTAISSIATNGSGNFTVVPNTGLPAGSYVATVAVFGDNVTSHFFTIVFTVNSNGGSGGNGGSDSGRGVNSSNTSYQATAKGSDGSSAILSVTTSRGSAEVTVGTAQDSLVTSGGMLAITMPDVTGATSYDVKLPASDLSANAGDTLTMNTGLGSISLTA